MNTLYVILGYLLLAVEAALIGSIVVYYGRAVRAAPLVRRLLPTHVVLISVGTLLLSVVAVSRVAAYPAQRNGIWSILTLLGVGMIVAALGLVLMWQRRSAPAEDPG